MGDHVRLGCEAAVVVEAAFLPYEKALEGCRPIELLVGRAASLEVADPHLGRGVHGPARPGEEREVSLTVEPELNHWRQAVAAISVSCWWIWYAR
jgi:hypothetical protein